MSNRTVVDRSFALANATVSETVVRALKRHGVEKIFGQSIPTQIHLLGPSFGIQQVGYRTENAGAAMADGYARVSGRIGVVSAQNGPAATLLVPGLAEALKASVPVLALVQEVPAADADRNAFQEINHLDLFQPVAKWVRRVGDASRIEDYVDMAITAATSGRPGPAVLLLPNDILSAVAAPARSMERDIVLGCYPLDRSAPSASAVAQAAQWIAEAERPIVIAGGGVHLSQACDELAALQEEAHLPVATTSMGKGSVSELHPLSVGITGYIMGPRAAAHFLKPMVSDADLVILVGNRTNQNGTDGWTLYPPAARYVHIDIDGLEIGRNYEALRLVGDARETLAALRRALADTLLEKRAQRRQQVIDTIAEGRRRHAEQTAELCTSGRSPIRPERIMHDLDTMLTTDSIIVSDASYSSVWTANYLRARKPGMRFISPRGMAGLGWGLPLTLGAKVARPEATVFNISGDGGFGHVWSELETAARMKLNVIITVLNNQILGYQKHAEDVIYGGHTDVCDFTTVDHAKIAEACGCRGIRVERADDYLPALKEAMGSDKPVLIDVITDPEAFPPISLYAHKT